MLNAIRDALPLRLFRRPAVANSSDIWDRWFPLWHVAAYRVLLASLGAALGDRHTLREHWLIGIGTALWGLWYWAWIIFPGERRHEPRRILVYFAGALPLFALLTDQDGIFYLLTSFLYLLIFSLPPVRWALTGAAAITLFLIGWTARLNSPAALGQIALTFGIPAAMGMALTLFIAAIIRQSAERRSLIEELQRTRAELAQREREAGMLEERRRLAREIHDTVAQGLVSVVLHLEATRALAPAGAQRLRAALDTAERVARETLTESRRAVEGLRPAALEESSLPEALRRAGTAWTAASGLALDVKITGTVRPLGSEAEVAALRVVQEALANVAKHAAATRAVVTLSYLDDRAILDIRDDGRGMAIDGAPRAPGTGYGVHGMRERVKALGGTFQTESGPGAGTTITATIPLAEGER